LRTAMAIGEMEIVTYVLDGRANRAQGLDWLQAGGDLRRAVAAHCPAGTGIRPLNTTASADHRGRPHGCRFWLLPSKQGRRVTPKLQPASGFPGSAEERKSAAFGLGPRRMGRTARWDLGLTNVFCTPPNFDKAQQKIEEGMPLRPGKYGWGARGRGVRHGERRNAPGKGACDGALGKSLGKSLDFCGGRRMARSRSAGLRKGGRLSFNAKIGGSCRRASSRFLCFWLLRLGQAAVWQGGEGLNFTSGQLHFWTSLTVDFARAGISST